VTVAAGNYAAVLAHRVSEERSALATRWLGELQALLTVGSNDVFPSNELLDHVPALIGEIAAYLRAPADEEIAANAAVIAKARELGVLRHRQHASVHQLLREYDILGTILESFIADETERSALGPSPAACFEVLRRMNHAVRTLMRTTVDTFVSAYTAEIQERNERIETFNRMASHELRSPIGTLLFSAAALHMDAVKADPARLAKVAATIQSNAERLAWLVNNLQRLAHLDGSVDVPSRQKVEVATIATEVARQLGEMAATRGVTIMVGPALPVLYADPAQIELVLMNLVSNAIKYSDPNKPNARVEIQEREGPAGGWCAISVRDNGIGIPESDRAAIFERFFRAHSHRDGELGVTGTGLGLAIVAECVRALGGEIRCESTVGQGSAFIVTLPTGAPS